MRSYSKISPRFWTGDTGRAIRDLGRGCQVLALCLLTGPSANMIGLYYLPMPTLLHETGIPLQGASKALRRVCDAGFASFEGGLEHIFVPEMAAYQIGEPLSENDNRVKVIISLWQSLRKSPFYLDFHKRYAASYHLPEPSPFQGACKPLRSQEQEQEQEKEQEKEQESARPTAFTRPTIEEVSEYCRERGNSIDPQRFMDYYAANGWKVGRNPMRDWRAAVRTWEKQPTTSAKGPAPPRPPTPTVEEFLKKYGGK